MLQMYFRFTLQSMSLSQEGDEPPPPTRISKYHQKAQNAKSSLLGILSVDSQWRGYSHHALLPEKFLLFANGTLTVWWFSGGPTFGVAHPTYIG